MKKFFCTVLFLLSVLSLAACGQTDTQTWTEDDPTNTPVISLPSDDGSSEQTPPQDTIPTSFAFDSAQFNGKLQSCAYAGDGKLFVVADKLYLYDTRTATVLATTERPLSSFYVQAIDRSYILSGMGDDGVMTYIYDDNLSLNRELAMNELLNGDFVFSETGVAASADGKRLAISAMRGVYLYDLESGSLSTLLDLSQNVGTSSIRIFMLYSVAFAQDDNQIVFFGEGASIPAVNGENGFSIYGSVAVDGSNLKLTKPSSYDIDEMQNRNGRLFFPQTFTKGSGSLLWIEGQTGREHTLSFSTSVEGKDGVYSSEQGNYVATAVLGGKLTIRVYEVDSGELLVTEVIENADSTYFNRIPQVYLLDEAKTAVVILGGRINEIDTLVSTFEFGE